MAIYYTVYLLVEGSSKSGRLRSGKGSINFHLIYPLPQDFIWERNYWTLPSGPSSSNTCKENSKLVTKLKISGRRKKISLEECRDLCNNNNDGECEYFNYDTRKSNCVLFNVKFSMKSNFVSGKKDCNIEGGIFIFGSIYHIIHTDMDNSNISFFKETQQLLLLWHWQPNYLEVVKL